MLKMFEEDQTAKVPPTQTARQHPARQATAVTRPKPQPRKAPRSPADRRRQSGAPRETRPKGTKNGQGSRYHEPEKIRGPLNPPGKLEVCHEHK